MRNKGVSMQAPVNVFN